MSSKGDQGNRPFHVQQLASDLVQELRIALRWKTIEQEYKEMKLAKELNKSFRLHALEDGDTPKQVGGPKQISVI